MDLGLIISEIFWIIYTAIIMVTILFCGNADPDMVHPENSGFYYVGATGKPIELINNPNSTDPTYQDMLKFLRSDKTDEIEYDPDSFMCGDFAEEVHNNAEAAGIKAAWVSIDFKGYITGHACNAFNTTDRGLVFVDCTGIYPYEPGNRDCIVDMEIGKTYQPRELFTYGEEYDHLGVVKNFEVFW